jgi:hypothetical protein
MTAGRHGCCILRRSISDNIYVDPAAYTLHTPYGTHNIRHREAYYYFLFRIGGSPIDRPPVILLQLHSARSFGKFYAPVVFGMN